MSENKEVYIKNTNFKISVSLISIIIVIVISISLFVWNFYIQKSNDDIKKDLEEKTKKVEELKKDDLIIVKTLFDINKKSLDKLNELSKISKYYYYITDLQSNYMIKFAWFNIDNWIITSSISTKTDNLEEEAYNNNIKIDFYNYQKTAKFIREYRKDEKRLFDLDFINQIDNKDTDIEEFNIKLSLRETITNSK